MAEMASTSWTMRARTGMLPVVLWAFGFATSLLLIGMWGRAVAIDSVTIHDTAETVIDSELATERVYAWLESGIDTAVDGDPESIRGVAAAVAERPEFDRAVDAIVADFIDGLFAEPGEDTAVRVEDALAPLVPVITAEAQRRNVPLEPDRITGALDTASVIELDTGEAASVVGAVTEARAFITKVVLLAAFLLMTTGALAVLLSDTRYAMVRSLSTRVVMSALTYALMFRVASWALDPDKGRSPVLSGGSVVLGSNGHVFVLVAGVAALVGAWGGWVAMRRARIRRVEGVAPPFADDDTRELVTV